MNGLGAVIYRGRVAFREWGERTGAVLLVSVGKRMAAIMARFTLNKKLNVKAGLKTEKPSLLFILTGLGPYSWYKLPFFPRDTFCASLPSVVSWHIARLFRYKRGECNRKGGGVSSCHCKWVSFFGVVTIGLCHEGRKLLWKGGETK